jgi:hypothetical protein
MKEMKARPVRGIALTQQRISCRQIGQQLRARREAPRDAAAGPESARPPALRFVTSTLPVCATSASHSVMPASHRSNFRFVVAAIDLEDGRFIAGTAESINSPACTATRFQSLAAASIANRDASSR